MSLADELLADLEEDEILDDEFPSNDFASNDESNLETTQKQYTSVRSLAKIIESDELKRVMEDINCRQNDVTFTKCQIDGPVESHPEYKLVVDANNMAVQIDNDINICHKFVRDKYSKRFPELESLVPNALDYLMTVKELGNNLDSVKNNERLQEMLTQATIMVVSVTASTTQGTLMPDEELVYINDACNVAIEINQCKLKIYQFVESRMTFIAPNLTVITGASIAAKLMGLAGGLTNLSKMPSCNVKSLGSTRKTLSGFSTTSIMQHTGFVFAADIVQMTPPDLRKKAATLVANKCTIAARVDAVHSYPDGSIGHRFKEEIERALDKLQEPPPVKQIKPLQAPIDQPQKRRGGKRVRKLKERLVITDLRKQANRLNFAEIEDDAYQNDLGFSSGQLGRTSNGRIRAPQIDEKTKVRISKTLQKNLQRQQIFGGTTSVRKHTSGTASTIAFTPKQGLEINNPLAAEKKVNEANAKYFSNTSGFFSVKPK